MSLSFDGADSMIAFLEQLGAGRVRHGRGRPFLEHLIGTAAFLERWEASPRACKAGLFHSIYGTESFRQAILSFDDRPRLQAVLGADAERLAFIFCAFERSSIYPAIARGAPYSVEKLGGGEPIAITADELRDLVAISWANDLEQMRYRNASPAYRATARALIAKARTLLSCEALRDLETFYGAPDSTNRASSRELGGASGPSAIEALFGGDATLFAGGVPPDRAVVVHGELRRLPPVVTWGELSSFRRLCAAYRGTLHMIGGSDDDVRQLQIEGPPPQLLVRMGLTAYFFDLLPSVAAVVPWRAKLAEELGIPAGRIRFSAWCSPPGKGLPAHFDRYDAIIVQLAGDKRWRIARNEDVENTVTSWTRAQAFDVLDLVQYSERSRPVGPPAALQDVVLRPGSVLYLPRGTWHETEAGSDGESLSLSIRLDPPTCAEVVLLQLRHELLRDPGWRRPIYGAWGSEDARGEASRRLGAQLRGLPDHLGRLSPEVAFRTGEDVGDQVRHLSPDTPLCRTTARTVTLEAGLEGRPARAHVYNALLDVTQSFDVSPACSPVLTWVADAKGFFSLEDVVNRFPAVARSALRDLVERLVLFRAVVMAPFAVTGSRPTP